MRSWLAGLDPGTSLSLYLPVPYCRSICHYCGCHTKAALKDGPLEVYASGLVQEIDQMLAAKGPGA